MSDSARTRSHPKYLLPYDPHRASVKPAPSTGDGEDHGCPWGTPCVAERKGFGIRLTVEEDELIRRERHVTGARSMTAVFEGAIIGLLADQEEIGRTGLTVPPSPVAKLDMPARQFRLAPSTLRMIEETTARHGWSGQMIARAALFRLAREMEERDRREAAGERPGEASDGPSRPAAQSSTQKGA